MNAIRSQRRPIRWFRAVLWGSALCFGNVSFSADLDADGIDDATEYQLLQRFAPVIYPDETHVAPQEGVGVPVSITWLLRNANLSAPANPGFRWFLDRPSVVDAINFYSTRADPASWRIENYYTTGNAPGDERSWPHAMASGEGVYGRVWKPWASHPYIYSVQYFGFFTWNETAFDFGNGNHEGDWMCVDYAIDTRGGFENPPILHAIYHNHGPQMFVTPELLELQDGRPVVYLERGTNEAWPNRGGRGTSGWPRSNGFATDMHWDHKLGPWQDFFTTLFGQEVSEYKIHREHFGEGAPYQTHGIPNIGDFSNNAPVSLCGGEGTFILTYQGRYGTEFTDILDLADVNSPTGPPWQDKMWKREWLDDAGNPIGPWTARRGPFSSNTNNFYLYSTTVLGPGLPPVVLEQFSFSVPQLRNVTYVDVESPREGNGSAALPYRNLLLGIAMTEEDGTVFLQPGSFRKNFEINQAITLTAPNGPVEIGQ
jgi:hypothetical protein